MILFDSVFGPSETHINIIGEFGLRVGGKDSMVGAVVGFEWSSVFRLWMLKFYSGYPLKSVLLCTKINVSCLGFSFRGDYIFNILE